MELFILPYHMEVMVHVVEFLALPTPPLPLFFAMARFIILP